MLYIITFTYATLSAMWTGQYYVIAIDYDHYAVVKLCPIGSNASKYVPWENLKYIKK
jgi:hypothetical protein